MEFEQEGNARAKYGTALLSNLAKILRARIGRGYSRPNLNNMRKYYLLFPKCQTTDKLVANFQTSDKLTWSHICELITIDDDLEREFYAKECVAENWSVDYLHRQKESGLFMRLALSKDKEGVLALAEKGQQVQSPEDIVKATYTLEFLGLPDTQGKEKKLLLSLAHPLPFQPSDDREAIKAHRRVSGGQSRSKCAARIRKANKELLKADKTER